MARGGAVTKALDQKVYNLIFKLLDDRSAANKEKSGGDESKWFLDIALARDLRSAEVIDFLLKQDLLLQRLKRSILEESVDVILKELRKDEEVELAEAIKLKDEYELQNAAQIDSDFENADPNNLMTVKDSNELNKSVVSMWNKDSEKVESDADEKKTKKRGRDSAKPASKQKRSKIDHTPPTTTLLSLGGLSAVTTQLMELVGLPILHPEIYQSTGVDHPRGILLYGPPGCGKTTIANALAGELKVPFINFSAPSVVSGMSGESEKKLREIFEEARSVAPCLIFIDEIDAITPKRDGGAQREMERRIVAQLLTLMDELTLENTDGKPVIVMGATNRPDSLDLALRRAGRFDREICLNVPDEEQRCAILKTMTSNLKLDASNFNYRELAKLTPGFVGADLKSLVTAAGVVAIKRIFESLSEIDEELSSKNDAVDMDVDSNNNIKQVVPNALANMKFDKKSEEQQLSTIQRFLIKHPDPLSEEQLAPLSISFSDFKEALPNIQPTAKREGFATIPDVTWKNVGALSNIRMELHMCIVQPIKKPELYQKVGISAPAGVLMWGPPGCGKTLLAKAVANESRANFISVKGPELLNKYVGESERAVRQVFQRARASVPCIIFFDELDALVPRRNSTLSESSSRVVNTLLTELDGLNDRKGIFVVGATNRPDMIDPAMLRPGRLDKTLYIELPTAEERLDILKTLVSANTTPLGPNVDLHAIANDSRCRNFSGADLSLLVREAGVFALKKKFFHGQKILELDESGYYEEDKNDNDIVVTKSDFDGALLSIKPSVTDKDRAKYERLSQRMGWGVIQEEEKKEDEEKN
ncbi:hypothetical protein C7M61_000973 [Candidozyma pseudohaemuli]|uniref:AAA+ ATPase domain-containing protein n=1 Tax=Candidozyma pseudohaemuli TaxID=418784 RepID=A0A2P7YZA1_9ASCO|nr:hypothetical protein C7M61_000973 [[Candida] pseudohaemulonii]PSK41292.1 hypothetical protein C7M61_000973 [[Candida] pseudohaemulonii]